MENDTQFEPAPAERFIDAALREKAHVGTEGRDAELVLRILQATVHRTETPSTGTKGQTPYRLDPKLIFSGVAAVAAVVALAVVTLNSLRFGNQRSAREEYHFVVQTAQPLVGSFQEELNPPLPRIEPIRHNTRLTFSSPDSKADIADGSSSGLFDLPLKFKSSFDSLPDKPLRHDRFTIAANDSRTEGNRIVFTGDVVILHNEFQIEADSATVIMSDDNEQPVHTVVVNAKVFHFESGATASASRASFDPSSGVLELSAVTSFWGSELANHEWIEGERLVFADGRPSIVPSSSGIYASPVLENR